MKKKLFFAAFAALALVGCNDTTQSELLESDLSSFGKASVRATFTYNPGTRLINGVEVKEDIPVPASVKVFAVVDYSEYDGELTDAGVKQFPLTAKGNGVYESDEIPVGERSVKVDIVANSFEAAHYSTPTDSVIVLYKSVTIALGKVLAGQSFSDNKAFTDYESIANNARNVKFAVSGKLEGTIESYDKKEGPKAEQVGLDGQTVELTIKYAGTDVIDERELKYTTQTGKDGSYSFTEVLLYDEWAAKLEKDDKALEMKLSVKPWADEKFAHYYMGYNSKCDTKKIWANEAAFKAGNYKNGDEWENTKLAALKDGTDEKASPLYDWTEGDALVGSWKSDGRDVDNIQANVTLFGKAVNQNMTAAFTPADMASVLGVGTYGELVTVSTDTKNEDVEIPEALKMNLMGWE